MANGHGMSRASVPGSTLDSTLDSTLAPGATIGILGGGQLGRMLALAAAQLGFRCHIYSPEGDNPAFDVAAGHTIAAYEDETALAAFAAAIDVATYEFENIPVATVTRLSKALAIRPGAKVLACAQDRLAEKNLALRLGIATPPFAEVNSFSDLQSALRRIGTPAVLKTRRFGYDGKGQVKIIQIEDAAAAWTAIGNAPAILEGFVDFEREVSVIATRGLGGEFRAYDVVENEHRNHILHRSMVPARIAPGLAIVAVDEARRIGEALDYVGTFAVELFVARDGRQPPLLFNEMAPRVHNSGHWTIEGAATSQFEQHIRAIAGWPLGATQRRAPVVEMINLVGSDIDDLPALLAEPGASVHHYGKRQSRPGRKMGHVTRLKTV